LDFKKDILANDGRCDRFCMNYRIMLVPQWFVVLPFIISWPRLAGISSAAMYILSSYSQDGIGDRPYYITDQATGGLGKFKFALY
jgi:hypothetical protein